MDGLRILIGTLSGSFFTGVCAAGIYWLGAYTSPEMGYLGPISSWAWMFAIDGGFRGAVVGLALGGFLGLMGRGWAFGTLSGAFTGLTIIIIFLAQEEMPDWDARSVLLTIGLVPTGALSGFLTSLVVSSFSLANSGKDDYVLLHLG